MCLELNFTKVIKLIPIFGIVVTMSMVVRTQLNQSPCPRTFQYEMDSSGQLYGTIGVYSFDENVVQLEVELSVGNHVNGYNGRIELAMPKEQVLSAIQRQSPIQYKVIFPRWENVPPKVTKISVNGQVVCRGPPLQLDGWFRIITSISLQHRFTIKVGPLRSGNPFIPDNSVIGTGNPQFIPPRDLPPNPGGDNERRRFPNPFLSEDGNFNGRRDFDVDFIDTVVTTTTAKITTPENTRKNLAANDLLFPENPFLNGRSTVTATPSRGFQTSRPSPRPITKTSPPSPTLDICGIPVVANPLVVNGNAVPRGSFPWLTAIFASTGIGVEYKCSGSLVSTKHVITAAHCVQNGRKKIPPNKLLFILGKLNIENLLIGEGEKMVGAEEIHVHPDYVPLTSDADIAVVILDQDIEFTKYIRPICIWSESDDLDNIVGLKGKVVGWGRDENNASMTAEPRQASIPVVSQEQCLRSSEVFKFITSPRTFCAGERNDSGPCNGDSGSGFIMKRNGKWSLKGIVSISTYDSVKQSCDLSNYVVFTDVSKFKTWLSSIIVI